MPEHHQNKPNQPEEDPGFSELHREYFIRETLDLRERLDISFGDTIVMSIDAESFMQALLFKLALPSRSHIARITSLPEDHSERTLFNQRLRESLNNALENDFPILFSIRPGDGLSISYNAGISGTEPYLTLLFEDNFYHLDLSSSTFGKILPTQGLVSIRDESMRNDLILELPLLVHMEEFQHLRGDDLRYEAPSVVFPLEKIAATCLKEASQANGPICIVIKDYYDPEDRIAKEYRFQMDTNGEVESLTIVGQNAFFSDPLTTRFRSRDIPPF